MIPQKVYYGSDTNLHGARLDIYLEEDPAEAEDVSIYDVEPEKKEDREYLPKRVRFYHAKIDAKSLKSGETYKALKNVIVLMITPYDPFTLKRMVYTIRNRCEEAPDMPYEDGAKTIFLYTKGKNGNPPEELRQFLHYMEHTTLENASNDSLRKIQQMVDIVKMDEEVSLNYMKLMEDEEILREEGRRAEQANTERERLRAEIAESRAETAENRVEIAESRAKDAEALVLRLQEEIKRLKDGVPANTES